MSNVKELDQQIAKQKDEGAALGPQNSNQSFGDRFGNSFGGSGTQGNIFRDAVSVPIGGGMLTPAKVGKGYGARWTMKFSKGGKVSSASKRADGIAQRGKTKGRVL